MKLKTQNKILINCDDWDTFVEETYGKPYCLQQQNGCRDRGTIHITVPSKRTEAELDEHVNDEIPEVVNGNKMGVKLAVWLARDPKQKLPDPDEQEDYCLELFWHRNFYPDQDTLANDLHSKGLIDAGEYCIEIDW